MGVNTPPSLLAGSTPADQEVRYPNSIGSGLELDILNPSFSQNHITFHFHMLSLPGSLSNGERQAVRCSDYKRLVLTCAATIALTVAPIALFHFLTKGALIDLAP